MCNKGRRNVIIVKTVDVKKLSYCWWQRLTCFLDWRPKLRVSKQSRE